MTLERGMELGPGTLAKVKSNPPANAQHPNVICETDDFASLQHDGGSTRRRVVTWPGYGHQEKLCSASSR